MADPENTKELGPIGGRDGGRGGGRGVGGAVGEGKSHLDSPMTMRFFSVFKYVLSRNAPYTDAYILNKLNISQT